MNITFFGTYKPTYARTNTLRAGLLAKNIYLKEVNESVPDERLELPEDFTAIKTVHRLLRKLLLYVRLISKIGAIFPTDAIVVLHPGHLDLPLAWIIAKLAGVPLLFDNSISPYDTMFVGRTIAAKSSLKARIVKAVERILLSLPDRVFVDTELMAEFLERELHIAKAKIGVVPLGANDELYKAVPEKRHAGIKVFFFGLFNPMHGVPTILESAQLLLKEKDVSITILGDGYLKPSIEATIKENNLTNVKLLGFVKEESLVEHIQSADIILGVFSNSPVFARVIPNKVFAALSCKRALITADLPATHAFLQNGKDALLVEPENARSLAAAIKRLATTKTFRHKIAQEGHATFLKTSSPIKIAESFISLIKGVQL